MLALIFTGGCIGLVLFILVFIYRERTGLDNSAPICTDIIWNGVQLGWGLTGTGIVGWLFLSMMQRGGTIEQNLPPGVQVDALLAISLTGCLVGLAKVTGDFAEHLRQPKEVGQTAATIQQAPRRASSRKVGRQRRK